MNKKRLIFFDILVFVLLVGAYLTASLTWYFSSERSIKFQTMSLADQTHLALTTDSTFTYETARYRGLNDYQFSYYSLDGGYPEEDSMGATKDFLSKDYLIAHDQTTYFEWNKTQQKDFCYRVCYVDQYLKYFRIGIAVPLDVSLAKNFLIYGSISIVAIYGIYFTLSIHSFSKSMNSLKKQVSRLRDVCGIKDNQNFTDSTDFYAKILRDSRKKLEKEFTEAKKKAKETDYILSSFTEGIILISSNKKLRMINKKAAEIFDLDLYDSIGRPLLCLNKAAVAEKKISTVIGTGIRETYFETIDSRIYQCEIEPLSEEDRPDEVGAAMLLIDVTDEFKSAKMKRDFFANASHELKSPLATILGYQEMIQQGILTEKEEVDDAIDKTIHEARRMNKIIGDMLELSSLENESLRPITQLEVGQALSSIVESERIKAKEAKVNLHLETTKLLIKVNEGDFDRLFRNLIENAIRYNRENGDVSIKMNGMSVIIEDTGIGIKEQNISRIFERFYRVDKARSRKDGGTGLGLSIVKYICEYYGYKIDVKSSFGVGTTFEITLKDNISDTSDVE